MDTFNASSTDSQVSLRSWTSREDMMADLRGGSTAQLPDVFMASRSDLAWLQDKQLTQPVDELLDERGVDFGDGYSRDALEAFSADNRLQCMPYAISPMVIYYNTKLVDFAKMQARGHLRARPREREAVLDLRPVHGGRRVRHPSPQAHPWRSHRARR